MSESIPSESVPTTADPNEELRKALVRAGLYGPQMRLLQQRYQLGQSMMQPQTAQGRQVGNTYVAASPLEHLANAIRQGMGAKMAKSAMGQEQAATNQLGAGREQLLGAMDTAQYGGQGGTLGQEGGGMARPPDPQQAQRFLTMAVASADPGAQHLADYSLKKLNYERQLEMMRNLVNYRDRSLDIRQEGVDQRERDQRAVPDIWGVPVMTPTHSPKGGASAPPGAASALPGAVGAGGGGLGTAPALPTSTALQEPTQAEVDSATAWPPGPQRTQIQPTVLDGRLPQDRTSPLNQQMQMPPMTLDGRPAQNRTTPLNTWNPEQPEQTPEEPEKPPMVPGLPDDIIRDFTREWVTKGSLPDSVHQLPIQARGKVLKAMAKDKAENYPNADFAPNRGKYAAGVAATKTLQNTLSSVSAFEETAKRNAEVAEQAIKKIENTGIPLLNQPIRSIFDNFGMDPGIAGARVGLTTALTEYSKIVSGGTLGQRLTDSQRHELTEGAKTGSITLGQWRSIRAIVDQDAANRKLGLTNQLKEIGASMADVWGANPAAAPAADGGSPDAGSHEELLNRYPVKK